MSPDEREVGRLITTAIRRASALLAAESVAFGALAAAVVAVFARLAAVPQGTRVVTLVGIGVVVGSVVALLRRGRLRRAAIVRSIDRAHPAARNLIVTADELAGGSLTGSASTRVRVFADAAAIARTINLRAALPHRRALWTAAAAVGVWMIAAVQPIWQSAARRLAPVVVPTGVVSELGDSARPLRVSVTLRPPAYTEIRETTLEDPARIEAIEGSTVAIAVDAAAERVTIEHDGALRQLARRANGRFADQTTADRTGYFVISTDRGARRTIPLSVVPDALPSVKLTAPGRDLVFSGGNPDIRFEARASDDLGLRSLTLRVTRVSGSGENFEFRDEEMPMQLTRETARQWNGRASRSLSELGLREGEMIVYRAVAADARPGDHAGTSDAFIIEVSRLGVAAGDAFTLPEEQTRYALSQQMLIIKTRRLEQSRGAVGSESFAEQALNLAVEQRMIRAELVFMLGGEVEDEQAEAEQSSEVQEGRLQNSGQRDLRAATVAMSRAEKALTAADTADALEAERAAVTALQRAFARGRYILRALASSSQLDASRRLTGDRRGVGDSRRTGPTPVENRRAALVQDLLRGVAELARGLAHDSVASQRLASVLATEAIRIDPASARLRDVAGALDRVHTAAQSSQAAAALLEASSWAVAELRTTQAEPAGDAAPPSPNLAGAFADLLRERR